MQNKFLSIYLPEELRILNGMFYSNPLLFQKLFSEMLDLVHQILLYPEQENKVLNFTINFKFESYVEEGIVYYEYVPILYKTLLNFCMENYYMYNIDNTWKVIDVHKTRIILYKGI